MKVYQRIIVANQAIDNCIRQDLSNDKLEIWKKNLSFIMMYELPTSLGDRYSTNVLDKATTQEIRIRGFLHWDERWHDISILVTADMLHDINVEVIGDEKYINRKELDEIQGIYWKALMEESD